MLLSLTAVFLLQYAVRFVKDLYVLNSVASVQLFIQIITRTSFKLYMEIAGLLLGARTSGGI